MAITNAALAQQISELVSYWRTRDVQFAEWLGGTPDGGPYGDGRFPLSDYLGVTQYLYCPAALESGVTSSASSAALQAALAGASKDAALAAQVAAEAARDLAVTHKVAAQAARDAAQLAQSEAANSEANANVHRNKAKAWASNQEDVVVESGLYSARHYAAKAKASNDNIASIIADATSDAIVIATADAAASASAAASSATAASGSASDASSSAAAAASSAGAAAASAGDADASADAAAASAAAAATFDPALYAKLANSNDFTNSSQRFGFDGSNGYVLVNRGAPAIPGYVAFYTGDNTRRAYIGYKSGGGNRVLMQGDNGWSWEVGGGLTTDSLTSTGWMQASGWSGGSTYYSGHGVQIGVTGGYSYMHSYNSTNGTYPPIRLTGSNVDLEHARMSLQSKNALQGDDTWLRLNPAQHFTSGIYSPGSLRVDGILSTGGSGEIHTATGYRWANDTSFYIYNTVGFSYGSWRIGGNRNGWAGLIIDSVSQPTFMSSGTNAGVYFQLYGDWAWYDDRSTFQVTRPIVCSGNVTAFSDARLKEDIETIDGALDKVSKLRGVSFKWKQNGERSLGFIAQEIEQVLPELVLDVTDADGNTRKSVAYANVVGVLVEAIKELNQKIERIS